MPIAANHAICYDALPDTEWLASIAKRTALEFKQPM
jgi:hypothetical protein